MEELVWLVDGWSVGGAEAACSRAVMSRLLSRSQAAATRSGVRRLMTPMVRWMEPRGRMALGWRAALVVTSAAKRPREASSWGREVGVTRGRRRKWVSWGRGLGGMVVGGGGEGGCGWGCGDAEGRKARGLV